MSWDGTVTIEARVRRKGIAMAVFRAASWFGSMRIERFALSLLAIETRIGSGRWQRAGNVVIGEDPL